MRDEKVPHPYHYQLMLDDIQCLKAEIARLRAANAELVGAITHILAAWECGINRDDIRTLRAALAAAEATASPPQLDPSTTPAPPSSTPAPRTPVSPRSA